MWTLKLFSLLRICRDRLVTTSWAVGWLKTGVNASHFLLQHVDRSPWSIYLKATSTTRWVLRTQHLVPPNVHHVAFHYIHRFKYPTILQN